MTEGGQGLRLPLGVGSHLRVEAPWNDGCRRRRRGVHHSGRGLPLLPERLRVNVDPLFDVDAPRSSNFDE